MLEILGDGLSSMLRCCGTKNEILQWLLFNLFAERVLGVRREVTDQAHDSVVFMGIKFPKDVYHRKIR
jgi:hypothetical protein